MKVTFEVPDWANGKHLYFFAGKELMGDMLVNIIHENGEHVIRYDPLRIKPSDGRCTGCSSCCSTTTFPRILLDGMYERIMTHGSEGCPFHTPDGCFMGAFAPFSCLKSVCTTYDGCTERMEVVA